MTILAKLGLGFGAVVTTFGLTGALILWNLQLLRSADAHVRDRVSFNEIALEYRHGAQDASLGAAQLASGNAMGEQRISEGTASMKRSRLSLRSRINSQAQRDEVHELERVENLTVAATEHVASLVHAKSSPQLVARELAFLSARADALNLRLEALFEETREEVEATMLLSDAIGSRVQLQTRYSLLACFMVSLLVSVLVFRSIARPLAKLDEGVRHISAGDLAHVIPVTSKDEIGALTRAFNEMTLGLRKAMTALDGRNHDMRVVLDHVNQGLLTMARDGSVTAERSAMVGKWLGEISSETTLWAHFEALDPRFASALQINWEQVLDDFLPLELSLDQLPKTAQISGRHLEVEYRPIFEAAAISKLLVVISDVSDRVAREKARAHEQEVLAIFQAIQRDKQGFLDFFAEGTELVASCSRPRADSDLIMFKRQVHTLKGNSSIFGIISVATTCHDLETRMIDEPGATSFPEIEALRARWDELAKIVEKLVGESSTRIELDDDEFAEILEAVVKGRSRRELARMVANWRMERVQHRLTRFAEQARVLAARLGKAPLMVRVESSGMRLPRNAFQNFWRALVHAIRNAVDHGIEGPEERARSGKTEPALLTLSTRVVGEELAIEVADNGRGIDWLRIAEKAREHELPAETQEDLVQALFWDGVSTADAVSDVSGRGVGMAALRDACVRMAGRIVIESPHGQGTKMSFRFPLQIMSDETIVELNGMAIANSLLPEARQTRSSERPIRASRRA
jgi:two-component system chemotaxis sensor kinase CheA